MASLFRFFGAAGNDNGPAASALTASVSTQTDQSVQTPKTQVANPDDLTGGRSIETAINAMKTSFNTQIQTLVAENGRLKIDMNVLKRENANAHDAIEAQKNHIASKEADAIDMQEKQRESVAVLNATHAMQVQRLSAKLRDTEYLLDESEKSVRRLQKYKDAIMDLKQADLEDDENPRKRMRYNDSYAGYGGGRHGYVAFGGAAHGRIASPSPDSMTEAGDPTVTRYAQTQAGQPSAQPPQPQAVPESVYDLDDEADHSELFNEVMGQLPIGNPDLLHRNGGKGADENKDGRNNDEDDDKDDDSAGDSESAEAEQDDEAEDAQSNSSNESNESNESGSATY